MILNKEFLAKEMYRIVYDDEFYNVHVSYVNDEEDLHDIGIFIKIGDIPIDEYDMLYWEMCAIINQDSAYLINYINDSIDEDFDTTYYGDPAFSSAGDYWGYILG